MKRLIGSIFSLSLIIGLSWCGENNISSVSPIQPKIDLAQNYIIQKEFQYATSGDKKGLEITIYSQDATDFEKRAQTVIKAAMDLLKAKGLYEVIIRMNATNDLKKYYLMAYAEYTPHKKNTWGNKTNRVWLVKASNDVVKNGHLIEDEKKYPISYIRIKKYLEK